MLHDHYTIYLLYLDNNDFQNSSRIDDSNDKEILFPERCVKQEDEESIDISDTEIKHEVGVPENYANNHSNNSHNKVDDVDYFGK